MLLAKLVVWLQTFYFICAKIVIPNNPTSAPFLKLCVEQIQDLYFKTSDLIINLDFNRIHLELNQRPRILQNNQNQTLNINLLKADAYVISIPEKEIEGVLKTLARSSHWNPRAKIVIILEKNSPNLFKFLNQFYAFNSIVLIPKLKSSEEIEIFTYFPFNYTIPEINRTHPILQDICLKGKLQGTNLFPPKLPEKWHNFRVKLIAINYPPYVMRPKFGSIKKSGLELQVFDLVRQILGFKFEYVNKTYPGWGARLPNGSFSDAYGDLQNYNADIGLGLFYANYNEIWYLDMSFTYMEDSYNWVVPKADLQPRWMGVVRIYGTTIWVLMLTFIVVISLLLYFFSSPPSELKNYQSITVCFLICLQCLLGQFVHQPKTAKTRLVLIGWVLFSWLIMAAFQSHLTSALNFNTYKKQISNVQELIDSKMKFGFYGLSGGVFSNSEDKLDSYIYKNYITCELNYVCFNRTAFQRDFATIKVQRQIEFFIIHFYLQQDGTPLIYVLKDRVSNVFINMAFSKGFPMFEVINKLLMNMKSSGIIERFYADMNHLIKQMYSSEELRKMQDVNRLELREVEGFFYMLMIGWVVSSGVFIAELVSNNKRFGAKNTETKN